jgi:hypothetical protein
MIILKLEIESHSFIHDGRVHFHSVYSFVFAIHHNLFSGCAKGIPWEDL